MAGENDLCAESPSRKGWETGREEEVGEQGPQEGRAGRGRRRRAEGVLLPRPGAHGLGRGLQLRRQETTARTGVSPIVP